MLKITSNPSKSTILKAVIIFFTLIVLILSLKLSANEIVTIYITIAITATSFQILMLFALMKEKCTIHS